MIRDVAIAALLLLLPLPVFEARGAPTAGAKPPARQQQRPKRPAGKKAIDPIGRPDGQIHDQTARFYVWFDRSGWHVRTTAKQVRRFHGTVRLTDARIKSCLAVGLKERQKAGSDAFRVNAARSELMFEFRTSTASDGFDLAVEGDEGEIEFELAIDEQKLPRSVFIGKSKEHPDKMPFRMPAEPQKGSASSKTAEKK
jgi:hypothetical protein